jgi:ribonuclease G
MNNITANSELIIDVKATEITIALIENKRLVELQREPRNVAFSVGDIYVGRVKKMMPGLNAAFVDVGYGKDAFLHYLDLGANFSSTNKFIKQVLNDRKKLPLVQKFKLEPDTSKDGAIIESLKQGQEILVQVAKEPISTKGPRLSGEISIAGRNLVLMPFSDKISVSQKISSVKERNRLRNLIQSIKPQHFGVIIRTVAEGRNVAELDAELNVLLKRWEDTIVKIQKAPVPSLLMQEIGRTESILRDLFSPSFAAIHVNDRQVYNEVKDYVTLIAPEKTDIIKFYDSNIPIYDNFGITKQIKSTFGRVVSLKGSAYLIIEHTEALHVIDVNSGNRSKSQTSQETNALEVNLSAAAEIAHQLRLRDLGGIIVIDFIDMDLAENRQLLHEKMKELMADDRAKHNILPLSKFSLMQITRQRVRPAIAVNTQETCPVCLGKASIRPSLLFVDMLENKIDYLVNQLKIKKFVLYVHPYVFAFIKQGLFSLNMKWKSRYGMGVKVLPKQDLAFLNYEFFDTNQNEIDLQEDADIYQEKH